MDLDKINLEQFGHTVMYFPRFLIYNWEYNLKKGIFSIKIYGELFKSRRTMYRREEVDVPLCFARITRRRFPRISFLGTRISRFRIRSLGNPKRS